MQEALWWCEYIVDANGPYREAIRRIISYFITDVEIAAPGGGDGDDKVGREEKQKYLDFLNETLGIRQVLQDVALNYLVYGNSFTSLIVPFRRALACPGCGFEAPLKKVQNTGAFAYSWSDFKFNASCPKCKFRGNWKHIDRRSGEADQLKVKHWNPHEMEILHDPYSNDNAYIWKIPDDYREKLRKGHLFHMERASWEVVEAVKNGQDLMFDPDVIYHMKEEALAGRANRGWGLSRVLTNFRQAWYYQVLHRYNEAIVLDYIIPFRVLTPQPKASGSAAGGMINDPVMSINLGGFVARTEQMLRQRRRDPARWNVLPFPLEYQALGGDANQLAPTELMNQAGETLLDAIGVPVDMYKGSLSVQAAPAALRLFEANWAHLVHNLNRFLGKLVEKVAQLMAWEPVVCRLARVTHADDLNRQMAKLQLMRGGEISRTTGLHSVGLDFAEEERRKLEEERVVAEATQDMQEEMEQSAMMDEMAMPMGPGGMPPGGAMPADPAAAGGQGAAMPQMQGMPGAMPGGGAPAAPPLGPMGQPMGPMGAAQSFAAGQPIMPNTPTTMEEIQSVAQTLASQFMTMPESQKDSALVRLKRENPTVHSLVKSIMEDMRRQARMEGGEMVMQQQFGKVAHALDRSVVLRPKSSVIRRRMIDMG